MKESARYLKIVEWSEEDGGFVGMCPGIIGPCCHGGDETQVYAELCRIVDDWLEIMRRDNRPLPAPTIGKYFSDNISAPV